MPIFSFEEKLLQSLKHQMKWIVIPTYSSRTSLHCLSLFLAGLPRLTMGTEVMAVSQGGKKRKLDDDTYTLTVSGIHCLNMSQLI